MEQVAYVDIPQKEVKDHFVEVHKLTETVITEEDEVLLENTQPIDDLDDYLNAYRFNQNFFTKDQLRQQKNFAMVRGKNFVYMGGFTDRMKHGFGLLVAGATVYEGEFCLNFKMGRGYHKFSSGAIYVGDFVNGKPHGNGTFTYPNKEVYIGEFQNGVIYGSGMWKSPKGDRYVGQWKNNKADGYGIHVWINGDKYEGQFKEFLKHGQGLERFANGDSYKGTYEGGKPNGYGEYRWHNGSVFKGEFKCGLRHGQGIWTKGGEDGDSYEGHYQNDRKCGDGTFKWSSGNVYKGEFFDDLRHGSGEMFWSDGSYYKGAWEKGVQHGRGIICFRGMPQQRGLFQNNVLVLEDPPVKHRVTTNNPFILQDIKKSISVKQAKKVSLAVDEFYGEPQPYIRTVRQRANSYHRDQVKHHNHSMQQIPITFSPVKDNSQQQHFRSRKKPHRPLNKRKK